MTTPFDDMTDGDLLRVTTPEGTFEGEYMPRAGMAFLHARSQRSNGGSPGRVEGPFGDDVKVAKLESRADRLARANARRLGEIVPGRLHRDREGYEARLERLANVAARSNGQRKREVVAQFDAVADEVALSVRKRTWMLAVATWNVHSNEPPTKGEMSGYDPTVAQRLERPRPQDFDPDPKVRRARGPSKAEPPSSTKSVVAALRAAGYKASLSVFSEEREDSVEVLAEAPEGRKRGRFSLSGETDGAGGRSWTWGWHGNDTKTDDARRRRCLREGGFDRLAAAVRDAVEPPKTPPQAEPEQVHGEPGWDA